MQNLGDIIKDKRITNQKLGDFRLATRGICCKDDQVLLIYSAFYDDYSFPGGGIEGCETEEICLKRECAEEAGVAIKNLKPYCYIVEHRYNEIKDTADIFQSNYYMFEIDYLVPSSLEDYEVKLGYEAVWIKIEDAIAHNKQKVLKLEESNNYAGVVIRELRILNSLLE